MSLNVRKATLRDVSDIVQVHYQTWLETYPKYVSGVTAEMVRHRFEEENGGVVGRAERWCETLAKDKNKQAFVAEQEERVVGFILAAINKDNSRAITSLYVLPIAQGQGAGQALMYEALKWLEADKNPIKLEVVETNQPAVNFYRKQGFVFIRHIPFESGSIKMPSIEMVRAPAPII